MSLFPKFYSPLANWPWLRISPHNSLYVIYCLILTAWQWLMSFTCIPVQIEPNKSPLKKRLLTLLLWEIGHLSSPSRSCLSRLTLICEGRGAGLCRWSLPHPTSFEPSFVDCCSYWLITCVSIVYLVVYFLRASVYWNFICRTYLSTAFPSFQGCFYLSVAATPKICLDMFIDFRERGMVKKREREITIGCLLYVCRPTHNLLVYGMMLQLAEPSNQGKYVCF